MRTSSMQVRIWTPLTMSSSCSMLRLPLVVLVTGFRVLMANVYIGNRMSKGMITPRLHRV